MAPDDPVRIQMKLSKKIFAKKLRSLNKQYEDQAVAEAVNKAEVDRDMFWRLFRHSNKPNGTGVHAVKNSQW